MLISRVPDESGGGGGEREAVDEEIEQNFQTASELFDLMAKDHDFEAAGEDPLTTRDLVLLYKNIDLGKQLMSNVNELKPKSANQYVESVVYQDELESDSELSETFSRDHLDHIVLINKERLDMFTNRPSNTLCHKLGDLEIQTSNISTDYDRHFLFKDPYIKEQLKSLKLMSTSNEMDSAVLPASLLDYICCKRLEDNYNFYMDNIIRYVKNTIEQLKRISNGDYLTEKAKQKWREIENEKDGGDNASKVLTTSTSIPLHVEQKLTGLSSTWDDLVHSEVDLRSLAKILEKKIVVEVPKLICGSYKLFSNRLADNLVISCARRPPAAGSGSGSGSGSAPAPRLDVLLQLQRSGTGRVVSNIDSIMIVQSKPTAQIGGTEAPPLTFEEVEEEPPAESPKIIELPESDQTSECISRSHSETGLGDLRSREKKCFFAADDSTNNEYPDSDSGHLASLLTSFAESPRDEGRLRAAVTRIVRAEAALNLATPEDMHFTMQALNRDTSLPEDSGDGSFYITTKKKSATRVRIKSPYENKSHILEERKRRKLLEIRERRERKKMAMNDSKVSKHKFCKSAIVPQASSSVTKLSITNKSFYNSIFGRNFNVENAKQVPLAALNNAKGRKGAKREDTIPEMLLEQPEDEREEPLSSPNGKKYINRSYYLDDAVTEMMYMQLKQPSDAVKTSASTSAVSNDSGANLCSVPQFASTSFTNFAVKELSPTTDDMLLRSEQSCLKKQMSPSTPSVVPTNTPKDSPSEPADKGAATVECRRSIDKIYMLMKKLGKIDSNGTQCKTNASAMDLISAHGGTVSSELQGETQSDSGTSLKHHITSSNPSIFSFEKPICEGPPPLPDLNSRAVEPKVIISSKQRPKLDGVKPEKGYRRAASSPLGKPFPDNPLKAISQLLHEFDHVQKTRQKAVIDSKSGKKESGTAEVKNSRQGSFKRRLRGEQPVKDKAPGDRANKTNSPRVRPRAESGADAARTQGFAERKKISDMIEEAKEARGEAVRGPGGGFSARLHALSQPKRAYVQALGEEGGARHPRPQAPDRLHRATPRVRPRRGPDAAAVSSVSVKHAAQPLERAGGGRRSAGGSLEPRVPEPRVPEPRAPTPTAPQALKKKMVAVESYVKIHYGRGTSAGTGHTARTPLLPSDIELSSMTSSPMPEESSALGSKLHRIIDSMLHEPRPAPSNPPTSSLSLVQDLSQHDPSADSDFPDDIFSDKQIVTAVECVSNSKSSHDRKHADELRHVEPDASVSQLQLLQRALCREAGGAFPKRLRIKNLTLTPKHSMQQIVMLQSGDTTSLVLKSKLSQNFQVNTSKSTSNELDLITLPLSTTHLDWRFSQLPMQIATVGYAFPNFERESVLKVKPKEVSTDTEAMVTQKVSYMSPAVEIIKEDKICQCFKGSPPKPSLERAVQAGDPDFSFTAARAIDPAADVDDDPAHTAPTHHVDTNKSNPPEEETATENQYSAELGVLPNKNTEKTEKENSGKDDAEGKSTILDYTTSLDMLVGLLNEIQQITTCTSEMMSSKEKVVQNSSEPVDTASGTALESLSEPRRNESVTSHVVRINSSITSTDADDTEGSKNIVETSASEMESLSAAAIVPLRVSKEAQCSEPGCSVSVYTDAPSKLHVLSEIADKRSLMASVLSGPSSSRSMLTFTERQTISDLSTRTSRNITHLSEIRKTPGFVKSLVKFHDKTQVAKDTKTDVAIICKSLVKNGVARSEKSASGDNSINNVDLIRNRPQGKTKLNKCCLNALDFDPMIKMKRDILVTVYSLLVLTVFAALSLPEMLLHQT